MAANKKRAADGVDEPAADAGVAVEEGTELVPKHKKKRQQSRGRMEMGVAIALEKGNLPQKKWFRQRAHCNPLSFNETFDR